MTRYGGGSCGAKERQHATEAPKRVIAVRHGSKAGSHPLKGLYGLWWPLGAQQPHPAPSSFPSKFYASTSAGLGFLVHRFLKTLRIHGYASAFWPFSPCYVGKFQN